MNLPKLMIFGGLTAGAVYLGKRLMDEANAAALIDWNFEKLRFTTVNTSQVSGEILLKLKNPGREFTQQVRSLNLNILHRGTQVANVQQTGARLAPGTQQVVAVPFTITTGSLAQELVGIATSIAKSVFTGGGIPPVLLDIRGRATIASQVLGTDAILPLNFQLDVVGAVKQFLNVK